MSDYINDGDVKAGSRDLTIPTTSGTVFSTENFNLDPEVMRYVRKNGKGKPTGKLLVLGETMGSATLNFPASTTAKPSFGDQFTTSEDSVTLKCTIEKVGLKETNGDVAKCDITFSVNIDQTGAVAAS